MRLMLVVVAVIALLTGCVHTPPWTPREQCAANGMLLDGIGMSRGEASGVASGGGVIVGTRASSYGESLSCRRPITADETCEVRAARASLDVKDAFETGWRNLYIGLGYAAFAVPGLFILYLSTVDKHEAEKNAAEAYVQTLASCATPQPATIAGPPGW